MGDDEEESPGARELPGPGRGGGAALPFHLGNGGRRGGKREGTVALGWQRHTKGFGDPPLFSSPPPPARSKEPFIILHIRTDTMVGLWGRGLGVWSLSSANKTLPEDEERIRK